MLLKFVPLLYSFDQITSILHLMSYFFHYSRFVIIKENSTLNLDELQRSYFCRVKSTSIILDKKVEEGNASGQEKTK